MPIMISQQVKEKRRTIKPEASACLAGWRVLDHPGATKEDVEPGILHNS
jgi:hypothetical protein